MRDIVALVFVVVSAVVAVAAILFALLASAGQNGAAVAAVLAVALGQLATAILVWLRRDDDDRRFRRIVGELKRLAGVHAETHDRLTVAERRSEEALRQANRSERGFAKGLGEIKERYDDLVQFLTQDVANAPPPAARPKAERDAAPRSAPSAPPATPAPAAAGARREALHLALEPVIDVHTGETAHYRSQLVMVDESGQEVGHDRIVANANGTSLRPGLDVFAVKESLALLPRLHQRNPGLRIFVPVGGATLMDGAALNRIAGAVEAAGQDGQGLVLELDHRELTRLSDAGVGGVAVLARRKIALAVTGVVMTGIDLASLRELGVIYLGLTPEIFDQQASTSQDLLAFCRLVRALQIQLMVNGITRMETAQALAGVARFASGPLYAPPRRVKARDEREGTAIPFRAAA